MQHSMMKKLVCLVLTVLLAAAALTLTGCAGQENKKNTEAPAGNSQAATSEAPVGSSEAPVVTTEAPVGTTEAPAPQATELGEGDKLFYFEVTFADGGTASYAIHTDADSVGEALVNVDLIAGEMAQYGLYVTSVCGEELNWDTDQMYWAFYENGEYALSGVDDTDVVENATYAFVATKG